jgi:hypothetical protein
VLIAYIEHQIPGRLRLRIPGRRGDVAQRVVTALSKLPDIKELDGNPLTGSIRYGIQCIQVLSTLEQQTSVLAHRPPQ